ncbi:MerR family transcriptional regulator [Streptacidiphilus fuscans]|uniref:MerR family transcriptional regulator n=1 Tax=Streptacidiphilus fuscans TaxID=2789292 RepID=A0A931FD81_9ACTN|nr:MerR family transcriptional regulator [Streptacidiphilus fuscans]MBF9069288.1 MerR family transcriptional regulator [Streptacidiphilus fuscans]
MTTYLTIGDFSRATHMTVKTLRHYHEIGLLEPADIDPQSGYRRYSTEQIPVAQVVRRFRELGMPLEEIRSVLTAADVRTRNEHVSAHLRRLEDELESTRRTVAALRDLLGPPTAAGDGPAIELRSVGEVRAAAVTATVGVEDVGAWFQGALGELFATVAGQGLRETGPAGGVYADELFTLHRGQATVFVPCDGPVRPVGRVEPLRVPAAELAVLEHVGPPSEVDRAYGALATYVARHELAVDGPLREYYLVGHRDTPDSAHWRTEVGWPVFRTRVDDRSPVAAQPGGDRRRARESR